MSATGDPASQRRQRRVWGLLIAMTVATFGGPVGIWAVLRGGERPDWPPDRTVEWVAFLGTCGLVLALMVLGVAAAIANQREADRLRDPEHRDRPPGETDPGVT